MNVKTDLKPSGRARPAYPLSTAGAVILKIALIMSLVELAIMVGLETIPHAGWWVPDSVVDAVLLVLISSPIIYGLVIRGFIRARDGALAEVTVLALTDPLTGLANRRMLSSHLEKVLHGSRRHKVWGALLLMDLDGFKQINDDHGHSAGDAVLVAVARHLAATTREEDVAARLGGDEFAVLIHRLDTDPDAARQRAERVALKLIELVCQPIEFHGRTLQVGASVGIRLLGEAKTGALWESGLSPVDGAIRDADQAMYQAKVAGKGQVSTFRPVG